MCGVFCIVSQHETRLPAGQSEELLKQRGPDHYTCIRKVMGVSAAPQEQGKISVALAASVLGLRHAPDGNAIPQPIESDDVHGVLCWNGEAWNYNGEPIQGSDTLFISKVLKVAEQHAQNAEQNVLNVISLIQGPFAIIYYSQAQQKIFFGRDPIGRRSLLRARTSNHSLVLSSVSDKTIANDWDEVEADGIYVADLSTLIATRDAVIPVSLIPYRIATQYSSVKSTTIALPWDQLNMATPPEEQSHAPYRLTAQSDFCLLVHDLLLKSMQTRLPWRLETYHPPITILFSGGLDCTLLARLAHDCLRPGAVIDLVNVAFQNPRVHRDLTEGSSPYDLCPDRITARQSYDELKAACPDRTFILNCVDVPYIESCRYKEEIKSLIYPHDTEMDISIAMALFFAAKGATKGKVLFSGLGADELFGGYQRHALAFKRGGYIALLDEMNLDISRLGKRNLGRDDRVISRWGKEVRYPYLDESVVKEALKAPVWEKVGFGLERTTGDEQTVDLDDKLVLRCIAAHLGLTQVANEKKRAIQFGTRSAKMESGRTKGTHKIV